MSRYDFYRLEKPKEMGKEEISLYDSLVGTTRYIACYDRYEKDKSVRKLYFESILTKRELVVLYNAKLDDEPVIVKATVVYKIQEHINTVIENVIFNQGLDIEIEDVYDEDNDDYNFTEEQKKLVYPLAAIRVYSFSTNY